MRSVGNIEPRPSRQKAAERQSSAVFFCPGGAVRFSISIRPKTARFRGGARPGNGEIGKKPSKIAGFRLWHATRLSNSANAISLTSGLALGHRCGVISGVSLECSQVDSLQVCRPCDLDRCRKARDENTVYPQCDTTKPLQRFDNVRGKLSGS